MFTIVVDEKEEKLSLLFPTTGCYLKVLFLLKNVGGAVV